MSREFSLVLLGAGLLTAGYFAAPSPAEELDQKAEEQAAARVGHNTTSTHHRSHLPMLLFLHSPAFTSAHAGGGRTAAMSSVSRGGFGGVGHAVGAGGAAS